MKNKMLLKFLVLFLASPLLMTTLRAQNRMVSGTVIDRQTSAPLAGVTIRVKGTNSNAISSENGTFTIAVSAGANTLVISYVGYRQQEENIDGKSSVEILLERGVNSLDEIVVTGYGEQRKGDLTGAIAVVDVSAMKAQPAASATEAMQGKAAGVNIINDGSPGSTPQIRIRGYSTINNNDPLYIIDGVPFQGNISWLNQNDIQSLQILKDASSASIYGSRANNGVIIITTTKGKEGAPKLNFSSYYGNSVPNRSTFPKFLNPLQFAQYRYQSYLNADQDPGASLGVMYGPGADPVLPDYLLAGALSGVNISAADADPSKYNADPQNFYQIIKANHEGTDWMRAITQNAPVQSYQLGANGGGKNSSYAFSMNYLDQKGTIRYTSFKRYTVRSNVQLSVLKDRLKLGENIQFSRTEGIGFATNTANPGGGQAKYSPVGNIYKMQTIIPVYDIGGNFAGARAATLGDAKNPLAILYRGRDNYRNDNQIFGDLFAEVNILEGLNARTSFGAILNNSNSQNIRYPAMEDAVSISVNGYGAAQGYATQWSWTNTLSYKRLFAEKHSVNLMVGTEAISNSSRTLSGSRDGYFLVGDQNYYYLSTGSSNIINGETGYKNSLSSIFARVDYSFSDKYLLNGTVRRDGSSNFGFGNLYAIFPAFSAAWRVSNEAFMNRAAWINDLKLRVGYGETGNQNIPGSNAFDLYQITNTTSYYPMIGSGSLTPGASQSQIGNTALQWEKLKSTNVGIDFSVLNNMLDGSIDYYNKKTTKMLFPVPLLRQTAGMANSPFRNVGSMLNRGIEVVLNYHYLNDNSRDFHFDVGVNFAKNENKIVMLAPGIDQTTYDASELTTTIFMVGKPYGEFYGYRQEGIFQNDAEVAASTQPGARVGGMKYADVNGDKKFSDADRTTLGSPFPDFTYGINLNVSYKNFDLSAFFYGSQGNKIYNVTRLYTDFQLFPSAASDRLLNTWSPTNSSSLIPSPSALSSSLEYQSSSYYVEDGSYFRLKNLQIGYVIDSRTINQLISRLRVYGSVTNLFTLTKYSGLDPEVSQVNSTFSLPGIDLGIYPTPRQFLIGINADF